MDVQQTLISTAPAPPFFAFSDDERLALLEAQLAYAAAHSSFYRERFHDRPLIGRLSEIASLPFTTHEDIRLHGREMVCVPASQIQRIVTLQTSGTSGEEKRIYFTGNDLERTIQFFSQGMAWLCGSGDQVGILMPSQSAYGVGQLLFHALARIGAVPLPCGKSGVIDKRATQGLLRTKPEVLVATPWQARMVALALPSYRPRGVLLSADCLSSTLRAFLEERWQCLVLDHYGLTESGLGCAVESPLHDGCFLRRDELVAEIVDPATGASLGQGQTGEIVLTTLRREGMPLIRYRTGDLGCLLPGTPDRLDPDIRRLQSDAELNGAVIRMSDLDAALCSLPWLVDYTAHWSARLRRMLLCVTLTGKTPSHPAMYIEELLAQLPFFQSAQFEIRFSPKPWDADIAIRQAKRRIRLD